MFHFSSNCLVDVISCKAHLLSGFTVYAQLRRWYDTWFFSRALVKFSLDRGVNVLLKPSVAIAAPFVILLSLATGPTDDAKICESRTAFDR